jgi:membrane protein DedA with SNARE-associated domain
MDIFQEFARYLIHFFNAHKFGGLFFLVFIEEAGIPIPVPGDALVMIAGLARHKTPLYAIQVLALASSAVFLGSSILYFVARSGGRPLITRYGRLLRLNEKRLELLERWFARHGVVAMIAGRLIPGLRIPTTILAGISGMPYTVYAPAAALAAVIWSAFFFFLGALVQHELRYITSIIAGLLDTLTSSVLVLWLLIGLLSLAGGALVTHRVHLHVRHQRHRRLSSPLQAAAPPEDGTEPAPSQRADTTPTT